MLVQCTCYGHQGRAGAVTALRTFFCATQWLGRIHACMQADAYVASGQQAKAVAYLQRLRSRAPAVSALGVRAVDAPATGSSSVVAGAGVEGSAGGMAGEAAPAAQSSPAAPVASTTGEAGGAISAGRPLRPLEPVSVELLLAKVYSAWRGHDGDALATCASLPSVCALLHQEHALLTMGAEHASLGMGALRGPCSNATGMTRLPSAPFPAMQWCHCTPIPYHHAKSLADMTLSYLASRKIIEATWPGACSCASGGDARTRSACSCRFVGEPSVVRVTVGKGMCKYGDKLLALVPELCVV
jgi:hypothetical protein